MKGNIKNANGIIYYSEEALANIVGISTTECYGVVGMALKDAKDGFWQLIKNDGLNKGVKIHSKENQLFIELYIIVEYGTKISIIANNIIQKIRYNVENYTGLKVAAITVNVQGVRV
ncbi:Asp23/Gls24 family envelope stress response protein [Clostridium sp.]|uniref:Asp23/Gls24 family envelope stress response protein n=1 Tax=Clostridium sp. TaxID=1506 RepID=UPI001A417BEF|nr:Asp23/Gls24 family envelope stress response protein [Clostridium sp.]MBK5234193.1 Asp23/Gls24 family envelope stress response protein [Clostridium sp.]